MLALAGLALAVILYELEIANKQSLFETFEHKSPEEIERQTQEALYETKS